MTAVAAGPSGSRVLPLWRALQGAEVWLAFGVMTIVALLVVPLPPTAVDALLALSIALSVVVLLVTLSAAEPLEFSVFPSLLLLLTLFRLGLNVSCTRLILGDGQAGRVIAAFGNAVIGGNYVVGLVIFLILVVINFMVITKGAGRIAEVAARFTLDAMPGRQMSIDADLGAGLIDEAEARRRREEINRHADFYGAMDGAAKFVRGDAVASLVITGINLVGGFVIGMTQRGLGVSQALSTYGALTVGQGLVNQIPALIVSTSAGILVTYGSAGTQVAPTILAQLGRHPRALWIATAVLASLALVPGFPALPFLLTSGVAGGAAWVAGKAERAAKRAPAAPGTTPAAAPAAAPTDLLAVEPLELEVGYSLVPLVDEAQRGDLLQRIALVRKQIALELGILVPPVRIRDNIQLPSTEYRVRLRGTEVARGEVMPRYLLALNGTGVTEPIEGIRTTDPSFGMPAVWIVPERRIEAEAAGYRVVEPQTVLATHLMDTVRRHAAELLGRQETKELLDGLKHRTPAVVEDAVPAKLPLGAVHRVLQRLLREQVSIRNLPTILEALSDAADQTKDVELLTEQVRHALATEIARQHQDEGGAIRGIVVGPRLETALLSLFSPKPQRFGGSLEPDDVARALRTLHDIIRSHRRDGESPPLITPPALRVGVRRLVEPVLPNVPVLSLGELPPDTPIQSLATWELPVAA
ncbi:MAG TPA: flagellar biosynthesis protein FlhA [Gemmatimonadales bacterium]|nr:flagellar biosynthesis protein FlhA [Gemmatimonadales bacterium]